MKEKWLLAGSFRLAQPAFLYNTGPPPRSGTTHSGPVTSIISQETLYTCLQANLTETIPQLILFPDNSSSVK